MSKQTKDTSYRDACARRLREARERRFLETGDPRFETARAFARHLGIKGESYTHHENGTRAFSPEDAMRYAAKLGTSAGYLLGFGEAPEAAEVTIMGEAGLTAWIDPRFAVERTRNATILAVPNPRGEAVRFAVEVVDGSVNKVIEAGEYAICVPYTGDIRMHPGQLVYVEQQRNGLVQKTIRYVLMGAKGVFKLKTLSSDPQYENTITYPSPNKDEPVTVIGRVIGRYSDIDTVSV